MWLCISPSVKRSPLSSGGTIKAQSWKATCDYASFTPILLIINFNKQSLCVMLEVNGHCSDTAQVIWPGEFSETLKNPRILENHILLRHLEFSGEKEKRVKILVDLLHGSLESIWPGQHGDLHPSPPRHWGWAGSSCLFKQMRGKRHSKTGKPWLSPQTEEKEKKMEIKHLTKIVKDG